MTWYPSFRILFAIFIFLILNCHAACQSGTWTWMHGANVPNGAGVYGTQGVASAINTPPSLYEAADWTDKFGNFWIFGGLNTSGVNSALWKYDPLANMWTWVKGPNAPNALPVYGTQGVPSPANRPGARSYCSATWTDTQGNLWLFGGWGFDALGNTRDLNDLWKYNPSTNEWTWMSGSNVGNSSGSYGTMGVPASGNSPCAREETSAAWIDANDCLWLFGGFHLGNLNDLWKYDPATNIWTWMKGSNTINNPGNYGTFQVSAVSNCPPSRLVYSAWKDKAGNFWLFGGLDLTSLGFFNDMWKYDPSANTWTWMNGPSGGNSLSNYTNYCEADSRNLPYARFENSACWTDSCGRFWMFGGSGRNDLWYYNTIDNSWTWTSGSSNSGAPGNWGTIGIPASTNIPNGRLGCSCFLEKNGTLWLFGGCVAVTTTYNDLWRYEPDTACLSECSKIPAENPANIFVPNVFTPNGDGENEFFIIELNEYSDFQLEIYDRWGIKVFASDEQAEGWNGKIMNDGNPASDGTYYYILDWDSGGTSYHKTGFITLLR
jgi:gliding motility-associated-like protein